jgi:ABC-type phosphate/phosphonate transport system substrate-binding protein
MKRDTLLVGAVAFGPAAVTIWDGFRAWFNRNGLPFDYVLYCSYDRQISELLLGHIDAAWNDPLSWVRARRMAAASGKKLEPLVMRDIDFDLTSVLAVRADSRRKTLADLRGATIAVGSPDSVESTLLPLLALRQAGLVAGKDYNVLVCESSLGYHGGKQQGEVLAAKALVEGKADAAGLAGTNYELFVRNGTLPPGATRVLGQTPKYDHCNLTYFDSPGSAPRALVERMQQLFLEMPYDDPELRPCMDLEWVKQWKPARVTHYKTIEDALDLAQSSEWALDKASLERA